jgi:hypothetical protein
MTTDPSGAFIRLREAAPRIRTQAGLTAAVTSIAAVLTAAVSIRGPVDFTRITDGNLAWVAGAFVIAAILALLLGTMWAIDAAALAGAEPTPSDEPRYIADVTGARGLLKRADYAAAAAIVLFLIAAAMTWIFSDEVVIHTQEGTEVRTYCGRLMTSSNTSVAFVRTKDGLVHAIKITDIKSNSDAPCP